MRKAFLMVYNDELGSREVVKKELDECPLIITWRYDIPHCFYLISESSAENIATALRDTLGKGKFIIVNVGSDYYGWNSAETWYLLKNKKHKPTET